MSLTLPVYDDIDGKEYWIIDRQDITEKVEKFIQDNDCPDWRHWNEEIKTAFLLTFG